MPEELKTVILENGLRIRFFDQTNRYYGDFHRVCIRVSFELPTEMKLPEGVSMEGLNYQTLLKKMGVPTADIDAERQRLITVFLESSRGYLEKNDFPQHLLRKLLQEKKRPLFLR